MSDKPSLLFQFLFLCGAICLITACVKSDNTDLDTKVRFINVVDGASQDFYLNNVLVSNSVGYGTNSAYAVTAADKLYTILAKNTGTQNVSDSISEKLRVGRNYSVYYYKTSPQDSLLKIYEDDLTPNGDSARVLFINLGYTLRSKVNIKTPAMTTTLGFGEKTGYISLKADSTSKMSFNLVDSANVVDVIVPTIFSKGKTYTILIDGVTKGVGTGKLRERLITNN